MSMAAESWHEALHRCERQGQSYVLMTVLGTAGSIPRDVGSKMLVTAEHQYDTIGGGELEFQLIQRARQLLLGHESSQQLLNMPLAAKAGQCCGGSVSVLLECRISAYAPVAIFGAGHVAQALVTVLTQLPGPLRWIDNRADMVDQANGMMGQKISCEWHSDPIAQMRSLPAATRVVIVTHNHQLDYDLLSAAMEHGQLEYIGCIGSETKTQRFAMRLAHDGFSNEAIGELHMPIGHADIQGKLPMEVAISICAELMTLSTRSASVRTVRQGIHWKQLKAALIPATDKKQSELSPKQQPNFIAGEE